jgi:hypothetical protein
MSVENPKETLPPGPPLTDKGESDTSSVNSDEDGGSIPLPPVSTAPKEILPIDAASLDKHFPRDLQLIRLTGNSSF